MAVFKAKNFPSFHRLTLYSQGVIPFTNDFFLFPKKFTCTIPSNRKIRLTLRNPGRSLHEMLQFAPDCFRENHGKDFAVSFLYPFMNTC